MDCREVRRIAGEDTMAAAGTRAAAQEHVASCPACAGAPEVAEWLGRLPGETPRAPALSAAAPLRAAAAPNVETPQGGEGSRAVERWLSALMVLAGMAALGWAGVGVSRAREAIAPGPQGSARPVAVEQAEEPDPELAPAVVEEDPSRALLVQAAAWLKEIEEADVRFIRPLGALSRRVKESGLAPGLAAAAGDAPPARKALLERAEAALTRAAVAGEDTGEWRGLREATLASRLSKACLDAAAAPGRRE